MLKGEDNTKNVYMKGHDAGLKGTLTDGADSATFKIAAGALDAGKKVTIGGKEYTIGSTKDQAKKLYANATAGQTVTVDGVDYTVVDTNGTEAADKNQLKITSIDGKIKDGSKVQYDGKSVTAIKDADTDGVDDTDSSVITAAHAIDLMNAELLAANNIGTADQAATMGNKPTYSSTDGAEFEISKGYATVADRLSFSLHVGSDADMTNKITVDIDTMNSSNLGIKGINVKDATGTAATYAIDAIADAVAKVSSQRSALGAVQNRLEHTIDNLDNISENTSSAESRIRDTDMAKEMVNYSKNNILAQAGQSMLAQANQSNQGVLSLLQ